MSLYLAVFGEDEEEIVGWVLGHYSDFGYFRDRIAQVVPAEDYPRLMEHSDSDGEWSTEDIDALKDELTLLHAVLRELPPIEPRGAFEHTAAIRKQAESMADSFHILDGRRLVDALIDLCDLAISTGRPISFQ